MAARGVLVDALRHYAALCAARGNSRRAVRILGITSSTHHFRATTMIIPPPSEHDWVAAARQSLGNEAFCVAWGEGQSITLEQATAQTLSNDRKEFSFL